MINKEIFQNGKTRAAAGVAICFVAAIALTGAYTWRNYQDTLDEEIREQVVVEEKVTDEIDEMDLQEASGLAEKAEEPVITETDETATYVDTVTSVVSGNFTEDSQMLWPVNGTVLMSFSMDKSVYFQTLDQYKYNPALIISAAVNDNVIAARTGIVKSIDDMRETGTTVTVDMGNGYECIYGQLKDVKVKVGDSIRTKDVLGYINEPTKYYSLEGANLYFEMRKDGQPVNPLNYMSEE